MSKQIIKIPEIEEIKNKGQGSGNPDPIDFERLEGKSVCYVLELKDGFRYIGRTSHIQSRLEKHKKGNSCFWLVKHPFVKLEKIYELVDSDMDIFLEDAITYKYMKLYSVDMVRGGRYCQININDEDTELIHKSLDNSDDDTCYNCGSRSHRYSQCDKILCYACAKEGNVGFHFMRYCPMSVCYRCHYKFPPEHREGHWQCDCKEVL